MQETANETKIRRQISYVYGVLIKFGFPILLKKQLLKEEKEIQSFLSEYLQPTPKRQQLIQWLILQIYPLYQKEINKPGKKIDKRKRIVAYLWKIGVMPYSKHTKNMDYQRYLEGLLGRQNSVNLLFNLCSLLSQSKQLAKSKKDSKFHEFIEDLLKNYDGLVNTDYDPYKVSFYPAFQNLSAEDFEQKYSEFQSQFQHLKNNLNEQNNLGAEKLNFQNIFRDFQDNKTLFLQKYDRLVDKIRQIVNNNQGRITSWSNVQRGSSNNRTIQISQRLPKLYKAYKQKIKLGINPPCLLGQSRKQIDNLIRELNNSITL